MASEYRLSGAPIGDRRTQPWFSSKAKSIVALFAGDRQRSRLSTIVVIVRGDGAIAIDGGATATIGAWSRSAWSEIYSTPVIFHFQTPGAAEAVMAQVRRRLTREPLDRSGIWHLDMSAEQAAAAIKAEAKGLYSFEVVHPYLNDAPIVGADRGSRARRAAGLPRYAIVGLFGAFVAVLAGFALKVF